MSYGNYPPAQRGGVYVNEGAKLAKQSWILGLIGLFFFGIILGSIGLHKGLKAKGLGADATLGIVLSGLAVAFHCLSIIFFLNR